MSVATEDIEDDLLPIMQVLKPLMLLPQITCVADDFFIDGFESCIVSFKICDFLEQQFFASFGMGLIATFEAPRLASCAGMRTGSIALERGCTTNVRLGIDGQLCWKARR